jgi:hypothetical protein
MGEEADAADCVRTSGADLSNLQMNIEVRYERRVTRAHTVNKVVAKVDMNMAN